MAEMIAVAPLVQQSNSQTSGSTADRIILAISAGPWSILIIVLMASKGNLYDCMVQNFCALKVFAVRDRAGTETN